MNEEQTDKEQQLQKAVNDILQSLINAEKTKGVDIWVGENVNGYEFELYFSLKLSYKPDIELIYENGKATIVGTWNGKKYSVEVPYEITDELYDIIEEKYLEGI